MKLLMIHSAPFSFRATEQTKFAEKIEPPVVREATVDDALVVMIAAEKNDEKTADAVVARAREEIQKVFQQTGAKSIVLYPYSHLSNNLGRPENSLRIIRMMRAAMEDLPIIRCPFGWYKSFEMTGRGHPMSELSRSIEIGAAEALAFAMKTGREHPVAALNQRFREAFLDLGLDEMINPAIVDDLHVYKQYGPEAPLILDRVFYIAGLDRADIGLSKPKLELINAIIPGFDREQDLRILLREYKEAAIEADDFLEELALRLKITGDQAAEILERVFPEFKELKPVVTKKTLRSHMTSNWFPVLERMRHKMPLPVRLFSVGSRFRREQRQDPRHLFESTSASVVVMDEKLTMEDGKRLTIDVLKRLGFDECNFQKKKIASRYYDPETDTEVFVKYKGEQIEVGNLGFYAPAALRNYNIDLPVFNIGFGVERMAMILTGASDLRALVFPQFYEEVEFTDAEIAAMITFDRRPESAALASALESMTAKAIAAKDTPGPAEVPLFDGDVLGKNVKISVFNWDAGKPMLSLAAMNTIYAHEGEVLGLPQDRMALGDKYAPIYDEGARSGVRFIDAVIAGFAADVEAAVRDGKQAPLEERWKIAKRPQQINVKIPDAAYDFIQKRHNHIRVGGPLFFGLKAEW